MLVFVAGGMTYSEMRETYLLSKSLNKDIIIGVQREMALFLTLTEYHPQVRLMQSPLRISWRT